MRPRASPPRLLLFVTLLVPMGTGRPSLAAARSDAEGRERIPLRVSLFNETTALPDLTRTFASFNPGAQVGTELSYVRRARFELYQAIDLGFFVHDAVATAPFATTSLGFRPVVAGGLFFDVQLGLGYMARVSQQPVFDRGSDGTFRPASSWLHRFVAQGTLGVGYRLGTVAPFFAYGVLVEAPFLASYSPVLPHQLVHVGLRFEL